MRNTVYAMVILAVAAVMTQADELSHEEIQWVDFSDKIIEWSGYQWRAKSGGIYGPGGNYFSDSEDNIRVDENGWLHLRITKRGDKWYCPELAVTEPLGYGDYIFKTVGRMDKIDQNLILGLYIWEYQESYASNDVYNGANEFDIEFGRWKNPDNLPAQFVCQPWRPPGNEHKYAMELSSDDEKTSHAFLWHPNGIACRSWYGHEDLPAARDLIHSWFFTGEHNPRNEAPRARMNFWCCEEPPSDGKEHEVIIAEFKHVPSPPPPGRTRPAEVEPAGRPWWAFWRGR